MRCNESRQMISCVAFGLIALLIPSPAYGQQRPDILWAIDFSSDASLIATCGSRVRVYEFKTGKLLHDIDGKFTYAIAFSPAAADQFASGGVDGVLRLWQVGKKDFVREFRGHDGEIWSAAFDKSGRYLASGSLGHSKEGKTDRGQFRLWETMTGRVVQSIDVKDGGIQGVSFSGDGKFVAFCRNMATEASSVEVYHVEPWKLASSIKLSAPAKLETTKWGKAVPYGFGTRFEPDQKRLLVAGGICVRGDPGPYKFACLPTGLLWRADLGEPPSAKLLDEPKRSYYRSLGITPDGKRFATGNGGGNPNLEKAQIQMRDVATGKLLWSVESDVEPYGVTTSPDGEIVAAGQREGVLLLSAKTGETVRVLATKK